MSDAESVKSVKKMLRSVLQSSKALVSINRLQAEYCSLCGEMIPLRRLWYRDLERYLNTVPSVVRLENRLGELTCFAAVCKETAHTAEPVKVTPRSFLQQPSAPGGPPTWPASRPSRPSAMSSRSDVSASGDYRQLNQSLNGTVPVQHRGPVVSPPSAPPAQVNRTNSSPSVTGTEKNSFQTPADQVQSRLTQLLARYCSGLWKSKLADVYKQMFNEQLHPQTLIDLENWTHICQVERLVNGADCLVYPPLPPKPLPVSTNTTNTARSPTPKPSTSPPAGILTPSPTPKPTVSPNSPLASPTFLFPAKPVDFSPVKPVLPAANSILSSAVTPPSSSSCPPSHFTLSPLSPCDVTLTPVSIAPPPVSVMPDVRTVEYPFPNNKNKAILYCSDLELKQHKSHVGPGSSPLIPSGLCVRSPVVPPPLETPTEQFASALVTDAKDCTAVTVRYVGDNYSKALEAMEDTMRSFYSQSSAHKPLSSPSMGRLAAVQGEDGDELARAQIVAVLPSDKVMVYYVDYGFSEETKRSNLLELHKDFLTLPFQATNIRLAGLESLGSHKAVLASLETLAVGKILLIEFVERCAVPLVVLYDTSQYDNININQLCLKAVQDRTMDNPLTVNSTYQEVCVTNVCSDGTLHCQLPSRGTVKLNELLDKIQAFFLSQVTSESLVSRPYYGKLCLSRYKDKWSRVEITNIHSNRVMDIVFIDLGIPASVSVTELREIPTPFLNYLTIIPPQAIKCVLADLTEGPLENPETVLWLREAILYTTNCSMKIVKLDQEDRLVHIYLYPNSCGRDLDKSINHQLAQSELWLRLTEQNNVVVKAASPNHRLDSGDDSTAAERLSRPALSPINSSYRDQPEVDSLLSPAKKTPAVVEEPLSLPPPLEAPQHTTPDRSHGQGEDIQEDHVEEGHGEDLQLDHMEGSCIVSMIVDSGQTIIVGSDSMRKVKQKDKAVVDSTDVYKLEFDHALGINIVAATGAHGYLDTHLKSTISAMSGGGGKLFPSTINIAQVLHPKMKALILNQREGFCRAHQSSDKYYSGLTYMIAGFDQQRKARIFTCKMVKENGKFTDVSFKEWTDACVSGHGWEYAADYLRDSTRRNGFKHLLLTVEEGVRMVADAIAVAIRFDDKYCGGNVNVAIIQDDGNILKKRHSPGGVFQGSEGQFRPMGPFNGVDLKTLQPTKLCQLLSDNPNNGLFREKDWSEDPSEDED